MYKKTIYIIRIFERIVLFFFVNLLYSQGIQHSLIDSLLKSSYDYLEDKIFELPNDVKQSVYYGKIYLQKAKNEEDLTNIANGYYYLSLIVDDKISRIYLDSLSYFSEKYSLNKKLAVAKQGIGKLLFESGDIQGALDSYLTAISVMDKIDQTVLYHILTHNIGLIKGLIGQNAEALKVYQDHLEYIKQDGINANEVNNYLVNLFSLSHSFTENKLLDSATYYNQLGISESIKYNRPRHYAKFVLGEGYNLFHKKDLANSLDSLTKSVPLMMLYSDKMNAAIGYLYIGKIQLILNPLQHPISLIKADSLIANETRHYPELVEIYELLFDYFKQIDDTKSQLIYLEKLIEYDKNLQQKYSSLYHTMTREYDQPKLLEEKEEIINSLEESNNNKIRGITALVGIAVFLALISIFYYKKRLTYKRRFEQILEEGVNSKPIGSKSRGSTNLPENVVTKILTRIEKFEKQKKYLDVNLSLTSMAKSMETNSNYLSRIINNYKGKSYSKYVNDLRIGHIVQELKSNKVLRQYTIKAIAHEIGYKNAESFTNAFHKRVGIYPSYYVRQLKKKENEV